MPALIICHLTSEGREHRFQVQRLSDGKSADPVSLADPSTTPVPNRPQSGLSTELRWYLERFLEYPFPPETDRAERVQIVLNDWGQENFSALFGSGRGRDSYHDAERSGLEHLTLKIASNDPCILAWPWEALRDPQAGTLAHHCVIERQLSEQHDPPPLHEGLPRDRINLLLVTARPYTKAIWDFVRSVRKRDCPVAKATRFFRNRPRSRSKSSFAHCVWNAWKVLSEWRHLAVSGPAPGRSSATWRPGSSRGRKSL